MSNTTIEQEQVELTEVKIDEMQDDDLISKRMDNLAFTKIEDMMPDNTESGDDITADTTANDDNDDNAQSILDQLSEEDKNALNNNIMEFQKSCSTAALTGQSKDNMSIMMQELTKLIALPTLVNQPPKPQDNYTVYMGTLIPKEKLREFIDALFIEITEDKTEDEAKVSLKLEEGQGQYICHPGVSINQELYNLYYKDEPINLFNIKKDKLYECMSLDNLDTSSLTADDILKLKSIPIIMLNNEYCVERIPCGAYAGDFMITLLKIDLERQTPCSKFYVHDKHILTNINPFIRSLAELGLVGKYKFVFGYSITTDTSSPATTHTPKK